MRVDGLVLTIQGQLYSSVGVNKQSLMPMPNSDWARCFCVNVSKYLNRFKFAFIEQSLR